jgi:hypothetical protein
MTDEAAQDRICMVHVAQVPGAIERMKTSLGQLRRVADVVQPSGGFEQVGVITENGSQDAGSRGDTLDMSPAAGEWDFEELARKLLSPKRQ